MIWKKIGEVCSEFKLMELKNVWKKESQKKNVSFPEVLKRQIQIKTKDTVTSLS